MIWQFYFARCFSCVVSIIKCILLPCREKKNRFCESDRRSFFFLFWGNENNFFQITSAFCLQSAVASFVLDIMFSDCVKNLLQLLCDYLTIVAFMRMRLRFWDKAWSHRQVFTSPYCLHSSSGYFNQPFHHHTSVNDPPHYFTQFSDHHASSKGSNFSSPRVS